MYECERQQIIDVGISLDRYRLISLSGGNVSMRIGSHILVTPSGMSYEKLVPADVVVMDSKGKVIEGERRPSVDTVALLHIFTCMPDVNAVIHTHQPYATAVGLLMDELPAFCTTLVNATLGAVTVAPYSSAASLDMGVRTVEFIGDKRAVILRNHGVVTVGQEQRNHHEVAIEGREHLIACAARRVHDPDVRVAHLQSGQKFFAAAREF